MSDEQLNRYKIHTFLGVSCYNQGLALYSDGCFTKAKEELLKAKKEFNNSLELATESNSKVLTIDIKDYLAKCDELIKLIDSKQRTK